jgi:hypothetical protein
MQRRMPTSRFNTPTAPVEYPELKASFGEKPDQVVRLQEILRSRNHIEYEKEKRQQLYKKYRRWINIVDAIDTFLLLVSLGLGVGGLGLLTTIVAAKVVIGLEIGAISCGIISVGLKIVDRRLIDKATKHDEIRILAESKLNSITDLVSKAITDGIISDEEFSVILGEVEKYNKIKEEIRKKATENVGEEMKKALIQKGREEARTEMMKKHAWV